MEPYSQGSLFAVIWEDIQMLFGLFLDSGVTAVQHLLELAGSHKIEAVTL